jgi:hypothetical protein
MSSTYFWPLCSNQFWYGHEGRSHAYGFGTVQAEYKNSSQCIQGLYPNHGKQVNIPRCESPCPYIDALNDGNWWCGRQWSWCPLTIFWPRSYLQELHVWSWLQGSTFLFIYLDRSTLDVMWGADFNVVLAVDVRVMSSTLIGVLPLGTHIIFLLLPTSPNHLKSSKNFRMKYKINYVRQLNFCNPIMEVNIWALNSVIIWNNVELFNN